MSKSLYRVQLPIEISIRPILNRKSIHVHFFNSHAIFLHNTMLEMHVNMLRIDVLLEIRTESKFSSLQNGFIHRTQQRPLLLQLYISAPTFLDKICLFRSIYLLLLIWFLYNFKEFVFFGNWNVNKFDFYNNINVCIHLAFICCYLYVNMFTDKYVCHFLRKVTFSTKCKLTLYSYINFTALVYLN